ncbi:hypothetical protein EWM64_g7835 [Hericium alpestre]|uniref:Uncharacterized protein n=1 Tax=Hericium alpestre TaxID=135208 RepID=A0A4Y9ZMU8_9AGAM|nr:hypothetical protein EWM64_g7835 [Hericium alpestre]
MCPTLKHLGSVAMHPTLRTSFQDALLSFSHLQSLELDLGLWNPQPPLTLQRALVAEVHMYGPELRVIVLWVASMRIAWQLNEITSVWEGRAEPPGQRAGWQTV